MAEEKMKGIKKLPKKLWSLVSHSRIGKGLQSLRERRLAKLKQKISEQASIEANLSETLHSFEKRVMELEQFFMRAKISPLLQKRISDQIFLSGRKNPIPKIDLRAPIVSYLRTQFNRKQVEEILKAAGQLKLLSARSIPLAKKELLKAQRKRHSLEKKLSKYKPKN